MDTPTFASSLTHKHVCTHTLSLHFLLLRAAQDLTLGSIESQSPWIIMLCDEFTVQFGKALTSVNESNEGEERYFLRWIPY